MNIIIKMDKNARIVFVNKSFEKSTFFEKKEVKNGNFWNLIDLCIDLNTIDEIKKYIYSGKCYKGVIATKTKREYNVVYFDFEISPIDREGNIIDGIIRNGDIDGFIFMGKIVNSLEKVYTIKNLKECVERRVFYKTA